MRPMARTDPAGSAALMTLLTFAAEGRVGDQGPRGQRRCNGNRTEACGAAGSDDPTLVWRGDDCGAAFCQPIVAPNIGAYPLCTLTAQPDPRCAGGGRFAFCDGEVVIGCAHGHALFTANRTTGAPLAESTSAMGS
jgi:hypothetical protein